MSSSLCAGSVDVKIDEGQDYEWEEDGVGDQSVGEHGVIDEDVEGETSWFVVLLLNTG